MHDAGKKPERDSNNSIAVESERVLLGSILADGNLSPLLNDLTSDEFYLLFHQGVFAAMQELHEGGEILEPGAIAQVMQSRGVSKDLCSQVRVVGLAHGIPPMLDVVRYKTQIKKSAATRKFVKTQYDLLQKLTDGSVELEEAINQTQVRLQDAKESTASVNTFVPISDLIETALKPELELYRRDTSTRVSLGIPFIDSKLRGGVGKKQLIILVSRTGGGKSSMAWWLCASLGKQGVPSAFASLEMSDVELLERALIQEANADFYSGYSMDSLRAGMAESDLRILHGFADSLKQVPIYLSTKSQTLGSLRREADYLIREKYVRLLCVDYLQLVKNENARGKSKSDMVEEVARGLKEIARDLDIPVIALCQMNREGSKTNQDVLYSLRGSSEIEQAADIVMHFDFEDGEADWLHGSLKIKKGRNVGKAPMWIDFNPKIMTFREGSEIVQK